MLQNQLTYMKAMKTYQNPPTLKSLLVLHLKDEVWPIKAYTKDYDHQVALIVSVNKEF